MQGPKKHPSNSNTTSYVQVAANGYGQSAATSISYCGINPTDTYGS